MQHIVSQPLIIWGNNNEGESHRISEKEAWVVRECSEACWEITFLAANKALCWNPFKNRLAFKMGQIVDKAASLCQSNELRPTPSISREIEIHTQLWQLDDGNHQIIIFTQWVRTNH